MATGPVWDRFVLVATSAWVLPYVPVRPPAGSESERRTAGLQCRACVRDREGEGGPSDGRRPRREGEEADVVTKAVDRHEALLREIMGTSQGQAFCSRAADPNPRYALYSRRDKLPEREFAAGESAEAFISSVVGRLERHLVVPAEDWTHEEPFVLRHRVVMDRGRFEAATAFTPAAATDLAYFVTLDFRLTRGEERFQRWDVSIVVWSELPFGTEHRPLLPHAPGWRLREENESILSHGPAHYRDLFQAIARHTERWLQGRGYEHSRLTIAGRRFLHPDFWIAVPSERQNPRSYIAAAGAPTADIARVMLNVDSMLDDSVSMSVVNGDYLVLRRMVNGAAIGEAPNSGFRPSQHPLYLVLVGNSPWFVPTRSYHIDEHSTPIRLAPGVRCTDHARCQRFEYVARQEFCMRDLVDALAGMESYAAFTLYDVYSDMQVWENHLGVYDTTAAAGGRLWDALATHLPVRRMRQLGKVHHAVELLHQTLLQGIADLNDLNTLTRDSAARVQRAKDSLDQRFDDVLLQRRVDGLANHDIRQAIIRTGVFAQFEATSAWLVEHAERIAERYQDLIDAVKDAFDERRVREGDAIQKAGTILAVSLAVDSIVSILSTTEPQRSGQQHLWLPILAYGSSLVILITALAFIIWMMRLGRLGDKTFRSRYDGTRRFFRRRGRTTATLWRIMKDTSTDALEAHLRAAHGTAFWRQLDDVLATELAEFWDRTRPDTGPRPPAADVFAPPNRSDNARDDITALVGLVGRWSIDALLFTERARRLYRYSLPKLTLLYRCISRMPSSFLILEHLTSVQPNVVSETELNRVLQRYARATGAIASGVDEIHIGYTIDMRLRRSHPATAAAALQLIGQELQHLSRTP